jgi:hypothetical protein
VARVDPFHKTPEQRLKFGPVTFSVNPLRPALAGDGEREDAIGAA